MRKIDKKATARRLSTSLNSLLRYTNGKEVIWRDLTPTFILGYEQYLINRGLCRNSTSFYMRTLRAIVNRARERGIEVPCNLFRNVYTGVDKTVKRAVSLEHIRKIRDLDLSGKPALDFARNVFMFAFFTRGMSFVDIAHLKKTDLRNDTICYYRRKTRQVLTVKVEPVTKRLLESFGPSDSTYLLPILKDGANDRDAQYATAYFRINRNLQKVGALLGLRTKLTLYVARHTWASLAHQNNIAISTISRALGHDSEKTTIIYLQTLDSASVDHANHEIIRIMNVQ